MTERCGACGAGATVPAFEAADLSLGAAPGRYTYRRCLVCASVFAAPQPGDAELAAAYANSYGNYRATPSLLERLAAPLTLPEVRRFVRHTDPAGKLIELGAGNGRFLERLSRCGWSGPLSGLEFDSDVAADASARTGLDIRPGDLNETELPHASYDAIVMRHVIEHVRTPSAVLEMVARALRPGAVLYIGTPDARALSARAFGEHWWGYEVPRHLVVFSARALVKALERAGFDVVDRWWGFAPQMWGASLSLLLADRGASPRMQRIAASSVNPVTMPVFCLAAGAEVAAKRSTMLSVVARRRPT